MAVTRYVAENAYYSNAGEEAPKDENSGKSFIKLGEIPPFKSKYYKTWDRIQK
ncbi:MAG: hypothetical protein PWP45_1525 [Tepidanaerobacteraceae bacterium]|nr:hypothetical protein [Tepidanaerobacteraceae bacterium]